MREVIVFVVLIIVMYGCKKDQEDSPVQQTANYIPMHVGDYWVYRVFLINNENGTIDSTKVDSTVISRDTLINGSTYFVFEANRYGGSQRQVWGVYKNVSGSLVDPEGRIVFSPDNFTDTLYTTVIPGGLDTLGYVYWKMKPGEFTVWTPFSNFSNTLNAQGTILLNTPLPNVPNPRFNNYYYAKDAGLIHFSAHFISGFATIEEKLLRYHIN